MDAAGHGEPITRPTRGDALVFTPAVTVSVLAAGYAADGDLVFGDHLLAVAALHDLLRDVVQLAVGALRCAAQDVERLVGRAIVYSPSGCPWLGR